MDNSPAFKKDDASKPDRNAQTPVANKSNDANKPLSSERNDKK